MSQEVTLKSKIEFSDYPLSLITDRVNDLIPNKNMISVKSDDLFISIRLDNFNNILFSKIDNDNPISTIMPRSNDILKDLKYFLTIINKDLTNKKLFISIEDISYPISLDDVID